MPLITMSEKLHLLQVNLRKMPEAQLSLLNDEDLQGYGLLLIAEPHCFRIENRPMVSPLSHSYWNSVIPTWQDETHWPFRSMIWVRQDLKTKQIPVGSADLTAITVQLANRIILAISVYIPRDGTDHATELVDRLRLVRETIDEVRREHSPQVVELVVAGDFNRHDQLWGGDQVGSTPRQGEAAPIIDLMEDYNLQSLLPRGTKTYESERGETTIDLMLTSSALADDRIRCEIHPTEHGSDHRAIHTSFAIQTPEQVWKPRLLFKRAPWDRIRTAVAAEVAELGDSAEDLDAYTERFVAVVMRAIERYTPRSRPSPYTKRWWSADLTQLRRDYTYWRNRARSHRRGGARDASLEARAQTLRREYHKSIRVQKRLHWDTFLAEPRNIWQASRYLQPDSTAAFAKNPIAHTGRWVDGGHGG